MARKQPIELFMPPNMLKAKVGGEKGGPDLAAIQRAEVAIGALKEEFGDWIAEDVRVLAAAHARYADARDTRSRADLLRAAHDIKGQAATFDFPLIARVAGTLTRLIDEVPQQSEIPLHLVEAHVSAIQVIHKMGVKNAADTTAQALCAELDARVNEVSAAGKKK